MVVVTSKHMEEFSLTSFQQVLRRSPHNEWCELISITQAPSTNIESQHRHCR